MIHWLVRVAAAVALAGWFFLLRPQILGGPAAWILVAGDSMEPTIHPGSLVVVQRRTEYAVGDVIAYPVPAGNPGAGQYVIHRIVGGSAETGFVVRGDNTNAPDLWRPGPADVVGSAWLMLPGGASPLLLLRSPIVVASFAAAIASYIVLGLLAAPGTPSKPGRPGRRPLRPKFRPTLRPLRAHPARGPEAASPALTEEWSRH